MAYSSTSPPSYLLLLIIFLFVSLALLGKTNGSDTPDKKTEATLFDFELWVNEHGRTYDSAREEDMAFMNFKENWRYIEEQKSAVPNRKYQLGMNRFADLSYEEYQKTYLRRPRSNRLERVLSTSKPNEINHDDDDDNLPGSKDWKAEGAVGPIKDQGTCRNSQVFSAVASVEAINKIVTGGELITLSEQELVDCGDDYTRGCDNAFGANNAFRSILINGGIHTDDSFPYTGSNATCAIEKRNGRPVVTIDGYKEVIRENEQELKKAVARQPVSTWINARGRDFQLYKSGILHGKCSQEIDHYVNVIGYGTDKDTKYWLIRNSWGTAWGEDGYLRLDRDVGCTYGPLSITAYPSYPVINNLSPSPSPSPSPSQPIVVEPSTSSNILAKLIRTYMW